jgi:hypothetical protein
LAGRSASVGVRDRVRTRNASCTPRLVHVSADGVLAAQLLTCNRAICPFLPFRALRYAARKWPVYRDFAMARGGLEPPTPRFSVVGLNLSNSGAIPAIPYVLAAECRGLDTRKLRSLLVDLGTEMSFGAQWRRPLRVGIALLAADLSLAGRRPRLQAAAWIVAVSVSTPSRSKRRARTGVGGSALPKRCAP